MRKKEGRKRETAKGRGRRKEKRVKENGKKVARNHIYGYWNRAFY